MIRAQHVTKYFDDVHAVDDISADIREQSVFGLVGTNGAGKSTFLRLLAGILCPDEGSITVDDQEIYENPQCKQEVFFIPDEAYFFSNATPRDMKIFFRGIYPHFDEKRFNYLMKNFELNQERKLATFSKGMKKQVSIICGVCAGTKYLLCDETFDGLDPVMRQAVKSIFAGDIESRGLTPIIASHNLRELEDICDHVGLLHRGGILFSRDLEDMKLNIHKIQCILPQPLQPEDLSGLTILQQEQRGSLYTFTVRGEEADVMAHICRLEPVFAEALPLSLEEIFISETEVVGYDIKKLIF